MIDKDRAASLVGRELSADALVIATDVPGIALGFGTPAAHWLREARVSELSAALARGEFGAGSMAPKVEAAIEFVRTTHRRAIVTESSAVERALDGKAGTVVRPARGPADFLWGLVGGRPDPRLAQRHSRTAWPASGGPRVPREGHGDGPNAAAGAS